MVAFPLLKNKLGYVGVCMVLLRIITSRPPTTSSPNYVNITIKKNQAAVANSTNSKAVEQTEATKIIDPLFEQTIIKRTAVVWTTIGITTECEASRLRHLVETSGGMDVWVLHAHHLLKQQGKIADLERSQQFIRSIKGVHQYPQLRQPNKPFDGMSGSSKSSFLNFLVQHSASYDFAWHVENDIFFTGSWGEGLLRREMHRDTTTDFLSSIMIDRNNQHWHWLDAGVRKCTIRPPVPNKKHRQCSKIKRIQIGWMFSRVSTRWATSALHDVLYGQIRGHHEAIVGPYSILKKFTYGHVDKTLIGKVDFGHKGGTNERRMDVESFLNSTARGKPNLLHPVKCAAYYDANDPKNIHPSTKTMQSDIEKWTVSTTTT